MMPPAVSNTTNIPIHMAETNKPGMNECAKEMHNSESNASESNNKD
jgi:hypothetical protein